MTPTHRSAIRLKEKEWMMKNIIQIYESWHQRFVQNSKDDTVVRGIFSKLLSA